MANIDDKLKKYSKRFMKSASIIAISIISAASLTACSLQFKGNNINTLPDTSELNTVVINKEDSFNDSNVNKSISIINETANKIAEENNLEFIKATVIRVVDGDTLVVDIDGEQTKVRLIGIDTPESVASEEYLNKTGKKNTAEGKNASEFTKDILKDYPTVYLQKDISETDKYGRLLRYVWLELPDDKTDLGEISSKMLNGILVKEGIAKAVTYKPDTLYQQELEKLGENYEIR